MAINLASKKILVASAHQRMRDTIKHILVSVGAKFITTAESGVNSIAFLKKDKFDFVLCDYDLLDKKTSQQVLEEARHRKLLPVNSIFIMVTDEHRLELEISTVDNKPDEYLIKPFSPIQLLSLLEKCLTRKEYLSNIENEVDSGNLYQAIYHCEQLLQLNDKSMRLTLLKMHAELALKIGDFKKAEDIYQNILNQRELPWARLGLGVVAVGLADYDRAIVTFKGLIAQYPMMLEAYDWLAKVHESMDNEENALSVVNSAVTVAPKSILRQKKLAILADKTENIALAQKAYMATIELGKTSVHLSPSDYSGLANIYLKNNDADMALEIVNRMNYQFKNDPEAKITAALLEIRIHQEKGTGHHMAPRLAQRAYENLAALHKQYDKRITRELRLEMAKAFCLSNNRNIGNEIIDDLVKTNVDDTLFLQDIVTICDTFIAKNHAETLIGPLNKELAAFNNTAARLFSEGDIKGALATMEQAVLKRPNNHKIILNLIKIIIYSIKISNADPKTIMIAQSYINKAIQLGMPYNQISVLQTQLDTFK